MNKTVKWIGKVTAYKLNVREWAGKENKTVSFSPLNKNTKIQVCDTIKAKDGSEWYYIKYNNKYGFVSSIYIEKIKEEKKVIVQQTTNEESNKNIINDKFYYYINNKDTHYISNSGSDERGKLSGGKAGDQTKKEWVLKNWYNRPWNYVLRYPDEKVRLKIAELGIKAALNNKVGYDQNQRNTYWTQLKNNNYDPSKITTACEGDCSAGVIANIKAAGHLLNINELKNLNASYSGNLRSGCRKAGFIVLTDKKYLKNPDYLLPGDILLYENHHAATNITKGSKV